MLCIRSVSNGLHQARMPFKRIPKCNTTLRIPDSNGVVGGSGDDVMPIKRVGNRLH